MRRAEQTFKPGATSNSIAGNELGRSMIWGRTRLPVASPRFVRVARRPIVHYGLVLPGLLFLVADEEEYSEIAGAAGFACRRLPK